MYKKREYVKVYSIYRYIETYSEHKYRGVYIIYICMERYIPYPVTQRKEKRGVITYILI